MNAINPAGSSAPNLAAASCEIGAGPAAAPSPAASPEKPVRTWQGPTAPERLGMLRRAIALVPGESIAGIGRVELAHHPVPRHLGEDGGGGDGE